MPGIQSAQVASFEFGAPIVLADVAVFRVHRGGGKIEVLVDNFGDYPLVFTLEVSPDGITYVATTTGNNIVAITAAALPAKTHISYEPLLRAETDKYFRLRASGGGRFGVQLRGHESLGVQEVSF